MKEYYGVCADFTLAFVQGVVLSCLQLRFSHLFGIGYRPLIDA